MDELFWDEAEGGYFGTVADDPALVLRLKDDYDGAEPSANSVAAANLLRLAGAFHDEERRNRARRTLAAFRSRWLRFPHALPEMLCALERVLETPRQVVLAGDPRAADFAALAAVLRERPGRRRAVLAAHADLAARAPWLAGMQPVDGRAAAYVCEDYTCRAPATSAAAFRESLA
jgi:uncharacterized protein YyaL (SSP411 family)